MCSSRHSKVTTLSIGVQESDPEVDSPSAGPGPVYIDSSESESEEFDYDDSAVSVNPERYRNSL